MDILKFIILSSFLLIEIAFSSKTPLFDVTSDFEWTKPTEQNKLGIFTRNMVHLEFKDGEKSYLWRTNREFTNDEFISASKELCDIKRTVYSTETTGNKLIWGNCTFSDNQITAIMEQTTGAMWNKNISYIEITTKSFKDIQSVCILDEFRDKKAYLVLVTNLFLPAPDEEVAQRIYKLDEFKPFALNFFEKIIEVDKILQFNSKDYLEQTRKYKCLLGIASGQGLKELKTNCQFKCNPKKNENTIENKDEL